MPNDSTYQSWGRYPQVEQHDRPIFWRHEPLPLDGIEGKVLPYGLGRSYGDVCLNDQNWILPTRGLNRFISFDRKMGLLRCEAGVSLAEILELTVPRGWFLSVTPGTKFVTVGGAIANDVHGKNHHRAGTFGCHVTQFELLRSDGPRMLCSPESNAEMFAATIGGLGLTGLITWAELQLIPVTNHLIAGRTIKFGNLSEFFELSKDLEAQYDYSVAWVDVLASGSTVGRGIFTAGNHAQKSGGKKYKPSKEGPTVPFDLPGFVLNSVTMQTFNMFYYFRQFKSEMPMHVDYNKFFYPLDSVQDWNKIYGKRGMLQYQCLIPKGEEEAFRDILTQISQSALGSFLAVMKVTGDIESPGMLSFPRQGVTLALDFPIKGEKTFALFRRLDEIVRQAKGRLYSAKDATMSAEDFQRQYPNWREFATHIDPKFDSSFWRRVTGRSEGSE